MTKKCIICNNEIEEEFGKFKGTMVKIVEGDKKSRWIYACSECQKDPKWFEKAKVKGA